MQPSLTCLRDGRRETTRGAGWNGIDYIEVTQSQPPVLCVHFLGPVPEGLGPLDLRVEGGRRVRDLVVTGVDLERGEDDAVDACLRVRLDRTGDFSTYRLCLDEAVARIDPRYRCADFDFHADCGASLDCRPASDCPSLAPTAPDINYLAKDYGSFRQLILDRLSLIMPGWRERHAADLGVTLVEMLAYVGDHLSYYQDSVATEAYLGTARRRVSVRRHARLVDYVLHEGCNARAFVSLEPSEDLPLALDDLFFITALRGESGGETVLGAQALAGVPVESYEVFEPVAEAHPARSLVLRAAHGRIPLYTWGGLECCLAHGATRATLADGWTDEKREHRQLDLRAGDLLLLEEVLGPNTGNPADADSTHRQVVRLIRVEQAVDPVLDLPVLEVWWDQRDALQFPLCLSVRTGPPDCRSQGDVSVARGNVLLVDHGRRVPPEELGPVEVALRPGCCACDGAIVESRDVPRPFRPRLARAPLTFRQPVTAATAAVALLEQDPRAAVPHLALVEDPGGARWEPRPDLLASTGDERHFVAEIEETGEARLRFGDGQQGKRPPAGARFAPSYRVGNGPAGNVGAETITVMVSRGGAITGVHVRARNPLAARGGIEPESVVEAKLLAPGAFRRQLLRAITPEDYATLAEQSDGSGIAPVQRALARLLWTGSWYEANVALDPRGTEEEDQALAAAIAARLEAYRRIGHDLVVGPARYVALELSVSVCVRPEYVRGDVEAALRRRLGSARLPDGTLGFFHPDNLTFATTIAESQVVEVVQSTPGVAGVRQLKLRRRFEPPATALEHGVLVLAPGEIPRLDDDPSQPENGRITLTLEGGR